MEFDPIEYYYSWTRGKPMISHDYIKKSRPEITLHNG